MIGLVKTRWGTLSTQAEKLSARIMGKSGNYGQNKMEKAMKFIIRKGASAIKLNAIKEIEGLPYDKDWQIEISPYSESRSGAQNRSLFGVIYPQLMEFMGLSGERDKEDLHEYLCCEYFGSVEKEIMGKAIYRPKRTTTRDETGKRATLSKLEFSNFIDWIVRKGAEYGCQITMPREDYGW